ncbi:MAG: YkgJ family cysteine cluster protein [Bacteroidetes bacterium]|nr:MAG: YkgJ family cysteine cluster protein [Bacteroidota bacterium]
MSKTKEILDNLDLLAKTAEPSTKKLFRTLKKRKPKNLDKVVREAHEEVFDEIDCLECANCCKTLGPRITDVDIARLSKHLRMKPGKLIEQYFKIDEDGDYVFQSMPCPFLMPDNYCMVYESRPIACREYPHTDRKRFYQLLDITQKNVAVCPAVYEIVEQIKSEFSVE